MNESLLLIKTPPTVPLREIHIIIYTHEPSETLTLEEEICMHDASD